MKEQENIKEWLEKFSHELEPEEILLEEEKVQNVLNTWPIPKTIKNLGVFQFINTQENFNRIISNPNNWKEIKARRDLLEYWVIPNAILLFGKPWYDKVKWRPNIKKGLPFPLFNQDDRAHCKKNGINIDETSAGKARIAQIVEKTKHVMKTYVNSENPNNYLKPPGGYLIESLKNEFAKEVGADLGYKLKPQPACPNCLAYNRDRTVLTFHGSDTYSCSRCVEVLNNIKLKLEDNKDDQRLINECNRLAIFKKFHGATIVCPNDACRGRFIPLSCIMKEEEVLELKHPKNTSLFVKPTENLIDKNITCIFCNECFIPRAAIEKRSGFKCSGGFITGLPSIHVWKNVEEKTLDSYRDDSNKTTYKDAIIDTKKTFIDDQIFAKQRLLMLSQELEKKISNNMNNSISSLLTKCFYFSVIQWMNESWFDSYRYFFGGKPKTRDATEKEKEKNPNVFLRKTTEILRGQEMSVHQAIISRWIALIENNIDMFNKIDNSIESICDFDMFCHKPKFTDGPITIFDSTIDDKYNILNRTDIKPIRDGDHHVRLAKIISITKDGIDYIGDMQRFEWHSIKLKTNTKLNKFDNVTVTALAMPGHPTHSPIQRIIRLRTKVLAPIIKSIVNNER